MLVCLTLLAGLSGGLADQANHVETVEFNTFGEPDQVPRTAILYRDGSGEIIDWRWHRPELETQAVGPQRHLAVWREMNRLFVVISRRVIYTRTLDDREVSERTRLPPERRSKLR